MKLDKRFFLTAGITTVLIMILVLIFSPKKNINNTQVMPSSSATPFTTQIIDLAQSRLPLTGFDKELEKKLPLYLENFETSVDLNTNISIYRAKDDKSRVIHLEIYGLSYVNPNSNETINPNVTAFKESYLKAMEMIEGQNIDPKKLIFIYGDKDYIRKTAQIWIDALKLRP